MDNKIRELRKKVRQTEVMENGKLRPVTIEEIYAVFEELNKLQRERFERLGSFLPCANGKIHAFNFDEDMWLSFDAKKAFK